MSGIIGFLGLLLISIDNNNLVLPEKKQIQNFENKKKIVEKAETKYEVIDRNNNATFIELNPITGRKHQLRKQLFNLGNSIIGDKKYGTDYNTCNEILAMDCAYRSCDPGRYFQCFRQKKKT